jgi:hypothetical protein
MTRFLVLAVVASCFIAPSVARAEPGPQVNWTVQVDPLTTALGIAHVLFERRVTDQVAVYIGPSARLYDSPLTDDAEEGYRAYGAEFGARWFVRGGAPTGWWVGVRGVLAHLTFEDESRQGGYVSVLGGYAWVFSDRWILSGALGLSYFDYQVGGVGVDGFLPGAHTGIGVVF